VPQRDALGVAFGLRTGGAPDRFLVGLAVLTLLAEVAEERPLLCVVDDAQWLDRASAQVLGFAGRRLLAEPVGLVFAAREPGEQFRGIPDLEVRGLPEQDARALLGSVVRFRLDEQVRDRILAETAGNPLALLELPRGLGPDQLAGGLGLPGGLAVPTRIEEGFRQRIEALPAHTRSLLLVTAAEPVGDPVMVWRAAGRAQLHTAYDMFDAIGMLAFAERARGELLATGETVRKRTVGPHDQLTPQEAQIARLARAGLSNQEIGAQLFLSARTVEWHLAKVFTKLEISSRRQLQQALPDRASAGPMT
jgi:DNA-binding CsgD family transcriptional regulator